MTSLASLRLTDHLELIEIALRNRPTVTRHRMGAVAPDICLITAFDATRCTWQIKADIIGTGVDYDIAGEGAYLPILSAGVRGVCANLGYAVAI